MIVKCLISFFNISNKVPIVTKSSASSRKLLLPTIKRLVALGIDTMSDYTTISYITAPNEEVARNLAKRLVENRLAACVNIVKMIESIYEWKGQIEHENESMLIVKSHSGKSKDLIEFVVKNHPYDCPEIVTVKVDSGSKKYMDWVHECVNKEPSTVLTSEEGKKT